jgi:monofunctional glycosyltransferase
MHAPVARPPARSARNRIAARVARLLALAGLVMFAASSALVFALRYVDPTVTSFMLQRELQARREARRDFVLRREWISLAALPPAVPLSVISSEDQRFFSHAGFDLRAMRDAVSAHASGAKLRGASTLTQQVAKNLFLWEGRSLTRKALEVYFTALIELAWSKRRIVEVYVNVAELGDGVFGVGAAAKHHFGRDARRLTPEQAALLAAILPDPRGRSARTPSAQVLRKQRWILEQMRVLWALEPELRRLPTGRSRPATKESAAPRSRRHQSAGA